MIKNRSTIIKTLAVIFIIYLNSMTLTVSFNNNSYAMTASLPWFLVQVTIQSSYCHFGKTLLYKYKKTESKDLSCPSKVHFM